MARRNRRRSRPRHSISQHTPKPYSAYAPPLSYIQHSSQTSWDGNHWQHQWSAWQDRSKCSSLPYPYAAASGLPSLPRGSMKSMVSRRDSLEMLRMFGGHEDECEGMALALCEPMLKVVMNLFDGGLDYTDP